MCCVINSHYVVEKYFLFIVWYIHIIYKYFITISLQSWRKVFGDIVVYFLTYLIYLWLDFNILLRYIPLESIRIDI